MYKTISFYNYKEINDPNQLKDQIREFCIKNQILGRILIGNEGINGSASGLIKEIESFKIYLQSIFQGLTFREENYSSYSHHKLVVRTRKEIVNFGIKVDMKKAGKHISPFELNKLLDKKEDITLLDARNDYETKTGKFNNAITLSIETFRDFPKAVKNLDKIKNKKIVMYCTGGIRCEKASAYLKQQGFSDVHQLDGGIINYINQYPNSYFEGSCFVFDDRLITKKTNNPITNCELCAKQSDLYVNCHNMDCDKLFISCESCQDKMYRTCSLECKNAPRQRPKSKNELLQLGIVEHYFAKSKIAVVRSNDIKKNMEIQIKGKTTNFVQKITELKSHGLNEITFPVKDRVRQNDKIFLIQ